MINVVSIDVAPPLANNKLAADTDIGVFKAADEYRARGWRILPFQHGAGKCYLTKEEESSFKVAEDEIAEKFAGQDVGIDVGTSGLVDVDIDCPEAAQFAEWLLPPTATIGREGKAVSHLLFRCDDPVSSKHFHDLDGKEIIAVLAKNRLPLPPSTHAKAGGPLLWTQDVEPAEVDGTIVNTVAEIAALTLITLHWPGPHARHEPTLALAGTLARAGWPLAKALDAVKLIAKLTNDQNVTDRLADVKSSYERHTQGKNTTGLPTLAKLLGETSTQAVAIDERLRLWLAVTADATTDPPDEALSKYVLTVPQLFSISEPEIEHLIAPFLPKPSLAMVFAKRGVGKTWFTLHLAICL